MGLSVLCMYYLYCSLDLATVVPMLWGKEV